MTIIWAEEKQECKQRDEICGEPMILREQDPECEDESQKWLDSCHVGVTFVIIDN